MHSAEIDGRLQVTAAVSLLEASRLVQWNSADCAFGAVHREAFEFSWRRDVDPVFGRLVCWMLFAAGAEFLAKGVCLLRDVEIRTLKEVPAYPPIDIGEWAPQFLANPKAFGTLPSTHFGTLGSLTYENKAQNVRSPLNRLCDRVGATNAQRDMVVAGYRLLANTIRNRDAHAYVPNVRDSHQVLVYELFAPCFTQLVAWLPGGRQKLDEWRAAAAQFVASL